MNVAEILSHKGSEVATISPDQPIRDGVQMLAEHSIGALVVTDEAGAFIGMFSERDLVRRAAAAEPFDAHAPVSSIMTTTLTTCKPTDQSETLMKLMTERRIRHLPVLDESGQLCGIVSIGDVVKERVNQLETEHEQLIDYVRTGR